MQKETRLMSVCKTVMPLPSHCHTDTGSGTVHLLISKKLIGKSIIDIISGKNKALKVINSINVIVCH